MVLEFLDLGMTALKNLFAIKLIDFYSRFVRSYKNTEIVKIIKINQTLLDEN